MFNSVVTDRLGISVPKTLQNNCKITRLSEVPQEEKTRKVIILVQPQGFVESLNAFYAPLGPWLNPTASKTSKAGFGTFSSCL